MRNNYRTRSGRHTIENGLMAFALFTFLVLLGLVMMGA